MTDLAPFGIPIPRRNWPYSSVGGLGLLLVLDIHPDGLQGCSVDLVLLPLEGIRWVQGIQTASDLVELLIIETIQ